MILILFFYSFLILFSHSNVICSGLEVWNYDKKTIKSLSGTTFTGATNRLEYNNGSPVYTYFISYDKNKCSYIQNLMNYEKNEIIEIKEKDRLSSKSYSLNYGVQVLFTENNYIYTNINSKFTKINTDDIKDVITLKGGLINYDYELLVGFAGTNKLNQYYINNNQLQIKNIFSVGEKLMDFYVTQITYDDYIYILYYSNYKYILGHFPLSSKKVTKEFHLDIELYNFVETYHETRYSINKYLIFSYNKNDFEFNFYVFDYIEGSYTLQRNGNRYNFLPFRNAKILKAFFLPNLHYLIYLIQKEEEKYAGALDIVNGLIIFNFKTTTEFISYESNYLVYGENNCLEKLCPFNSKNVNNCYLLSGLSRYLIQITEKKENTLVNQCSRDARYSLEGLYCYDNCPPGYYASGFNCIRCAYDLDTESCIDYNKCEDNKIFEQENCVCYSCKPFNEYKNPELNKCVDDCSKYNLSKEDAKSICISCKDLGKFYHNGNCEKDCGPAITDEDRNICVDCPKETPNYENGKCVKECSNNYTLEPKTRKCILCTKEKPYLQDGKCVEKCDNYHKTDAKSKLCINCQIDTNGTSYLQDNECVAICSEYYKIDEEHKTCINCQLEPNKNIYLQDNECVKDCDEKHIKNETNKYCINCQKEKNGPFLQNNECVEKCNENYATDFVNKICVNCQKNISAPYKQGDKCIEKCGQYYLVFEENKVCKKCSEIYEDKQFFFDGVCVKSCDISKYSYLANEKACIDCRKNDPNTPYLQDTKCVSKCNNYYAKDEENMRCYNCSKEFGDDYYFFNGSCVKDCPEYYTKNDINKICYKCNENPVKSYYENGVCVEDCSKYYYKDEAQKICIKCPEIKETLYYEDGKCVDTCSKNYVNDSKAFRCYKCSEEYPEKPYYMDNYCVDKCDEYHVMDEENQVCFKCHEKYKDKRFNENGVCVEKCSEYLVSDYTNFLCIDCSKTNYQFYEDNVCKEDCSPGYMKTLFPKKACVHCFRTYRKNEENYECTSHCTNNRANNTLLYACQFCKEFNEEKIYFYNETCVDECPEKYQKNTKDLTCDHCLKYYDKIQKKCVDKCPEGSSINDMVCEKCKYYDKKNNSCVDDCSGAKYPIDVKKDDYSICYECFCGYGNCLINKNTNIELKNTEIKDLYYCKCDEETYGKYCQYKKIKGNDKILKQSAFDNLEIKPLQDVVYTNKKNIFTVDIIKNKNSLRNLFIIEHKQYLKRRFEYFIEWKLIQYNCPGRQDEDIISNDLYFVIEPGVFIDDCENIIQLNITSNNNELLSLNKLIVRTKSTDSHDFNINITLNGGLIYILNNNYIKLSESNNINFNYIYKYYYVTEDGEEFGLTDYMKNNDLFENYIIPYCINIKAKIKNDYGEILETETASRPIYSTRMNTNLNILSILENLNSNLDRNTVLQKSKDLKSFFYINSTYNINNNREITYNIISFINKYLPLSIINENDLLKNNYALDENEKTVDSNVFISLINQLNLAYYKKYNDNDKEQNYEFYLYLTNIMTNSLNNTAIELLSEETILSYLRTIDNLLLVINQKNIIGDEFNDIYYCINLLKNFLAKNIISGTQIEIKGNYYNLNLIKPGLYTQSLSILNTQAKEKTSKKYFMSYANYKIENNKLQISKCDSNSLFCISDNNYDYLYDEITYLKKETMMNLIFSVSHFYNKNSFISRWNSITKNVYLNSIHEYPKQISDYSFIIEILDPINKRTIKNLKKFRYNLSFDLNQSDEKYKSDIICVAFNSITINNHNIEISNEDNCLTYIDSKNHKAICQCNTDGEVVLLLDSKLSSLTKSFFYQNHKYKIINTFSGSLILSSLALITIFSVFFILYEFYEDKNNPVKLMNTNMRTQYEYECFKDLNDSSKLLFALYLIYYKYSFFNVFSTYKYNHPRYIRFFIEIIKILLNLLISMIPLYYRPFPKSDEYSIEFDLENEGRIYYKKENAKLHLEYVLASFFYSLIASIIIFFITQFVYKLFEFKKMRRLIWKPKKDILKEFVYGYFKKISMFDRKFKNVKRRMLAYVRLCGKYYLDNIKQDKFSSYLEYKISQQNSNKPINNEDLFDSLFLKNNTSTNIQNSNNQFPSLQETLLNKSKTEKELKSTIYKNYSINTKPNNINDKKDNKLIISKGVQPFTLSQKSQNNDSLWNIYRLELIRNRYIFNSQNNEYYRESKSKTIKYIDLAIETQRNYSYILSNDISFNQLSTALNKKKINVIRLINFSLLITLLMIDAALVIMLKKIYEQYENYIILNWLIPVLFQIIIVNFIINYIFAFIATILLFSNYKRKKDCCSTFIFNLFVEKYMRYLFKIRTLINKYYREFENMK